MDTPTGYGKLLVADDPASFARMAADHLFSWTMETSKPVRVALSGGSTPRCTYQELAGPRFIDRFPWQRVHWFWGDERFVPPDHQDSNFRMAREAMLDTAPAPPENHADLDRRPSDADRADEQSHICPSEPQKTCSTHERTSSDGTSPTSGLTTQPKGTEPDNQSGVMVFLMVSAPSNMVESKKVSGASPGIGIPPLAAVPTLRLPVTADRRRKRARLYRQSNQRLREAGMPRDEHTEQWSPVESARAACQ